MDAAIYKKLALLTDVEAELCLNGLLKGLTINNPSFGILLISPSDMTKVIEEVATSIGKKFPPLREVAPKERPGAVRLILTEIAQSKELCPRLVAWLDHSRPTLLEPVTTALVLAGITLVLSTHVKIEYEDISGKKKLKVKLEKASVSNEILEKFLSIFS